MQGWLKTANSETLDSTRDMGQDGDPLSSVNSNFAKDVFGYSLNYFDGDYSSISSSTFLANKTNLSNLATDAPSLYNGNINYMVTTLTDPSTGRPLPQLTAYHYDQRNRIKQMKAFDTLNIAGNTWVDETYANRYFNSFTYDGNGNIITANAYDAAGGIVDNQDYNYQTVGGKRINNRLYSINDSASITSGNDLLDKVDFDNTETTINTANNYSYSEIGELQANKLDSIVDIKWTVTGKIKEVTRSNGCYKYNLKFDYDPTGNRVAKHVYNNNDDLLYSEYYVRDAQGNVMSTYKLSLDVSQQLASFAQKEMHLYGSGLIGISKEEIELISLVQQGDTFSHILGKKEFTGSNHLGNNLAVFSDIKVQHDDNSYNEVDYFTADLRAANDYAPFGGLLTERTFNKGTFPNSFNGKRDDPELGDWQDYGMRGYSLWARRFFTIDPLFAEYPYYSPFQFSGDGPIANIDRDGLEEFSVHYHTFRSSLGKPVIYKVDYKYIEQSKRNSAHGVGSFYNESDPSYVKGSSKYDPSYFIDLNAQFSGFKDKPDRNIYNGIKSQFNKDGNRTGTAYLAFQFRFNYNDDGGKTVDEVIDCFNKLSEQEQEHIDAMVGLLVKEPLMTMKVKGIASPKASNMDHILPTTTRDNNEILAAARATAGRDFLIKYAREHYDGADISSQLKTESVVRDSDPATHDSSEDRGVEFSIGEGF